jgi:hypothetical protein
MYRDKTRRKREAGATKPSDEHARPAQLQNVTARDLQRAATGVL